MRFPFFSKDHISERSQKSHWAFAIRQEAEMGRGPPETADDRKRWELPVPCNSAAGCRPRELQ